uniref:Centrosomal protein of 192 kDa-like n=1 Tax=Saccoglossus kowalevskii TaxID=10224 RepID=A0ABM0MZ08_SACKO|nr:PREDICTED: centrosomal protein of 192 kDa-like [Saccoglossus kowalevskii]
MFRPIKSDDSTEVVEALKPGRQSQLFKVPEVPQQRHAMPRGYNGFEGIPTYHMKLPEIPKEFSSSAPGTAKSGKKGKLSFSPPNKNMEQMLKQKSQSLPELADNTSHKTDYQRYEKHEFGLPPEKCPSRGGRTTPETVTKRQRHFLNLPNRVDTYSYPMPTNDNEHLVHSKPQPVRPFDEQSTHKEHGRKIGTHKSKKSSRERSPSSGFGESLDGLTMNSIMTSQSLTSSSKLPTPTSSSHLKLKSVDSSHEPKINYGAKSEHSAPSAIYRRSRDATQLASSNVPDEEKEKSAEKYRVSIYNMKKNREPSRSPERNVSYGSVIEQKAAIAKTLSTPVCDADEGGDVSYIGKLGVPEFNDCSVLDSSTPKKTLFSEKTQEDLTPLHFAQSGCKALKDDKNEAVTTETIPSIKFVEGVQPRNQLTTVPTLLTSQSLLSTTLASQYLNSRPLTTSQKHAVPSVSPSHSLNISPASSTVITSSPSYQPTPNTVSLSQNVGSTTGQSGIVHRPTFSSAKVSQHVATPNYPGQSGVVLSSVYSGLAPRVAATVAPPQATRPAAPSASLLDLSKGVVIPSDLRFGGVCCVGITVQTSLPIHNRTNRWINSTMKLISVTANDAQVDLENYTPFIMKSSAIICPGKSEDTNILFVPKHPGIFVAHLQISSSLVVAENTNIPQPTPSISVVTVHAVAEKANIQVEADNPQSLHFGEVAYGHTRSKALKIYNRGKSSVPIRLIISACSIAWHCYSFGKLDTRLETLSPGGTAMTPRGSSVLNIIVPGRTDNKASIDDPHLVLIDFKAPHRNMDHVAVLGVAEMITARVDVELDTPDNHNIASRALKVTVGTTRLHILKELLHKPLFLAAPPGKTATQFLPLKNAGNLMITVELKITQTQEFFSVIPATLTLKPDEMTDIVVKFTPVDAPVAIDSLLLMSVLPDGPEYEVKLQGEGTMSEHRSQRTSTGSLHSHKSSPQSMLLCNKQFVNWGGVPIGRALQQKVVLRNNLQNDVLKLRIFIRADHQDFQLQSSFGHQENLSDSRQVILKPLEDFPLHVLFAPTSIISRQAKLVMKPSTGGTKFTVPLYGYGGISNLIIEDLETMGSTFMSNMGSLSLGKHSITQITIQNTGPRAAFVKAIPFEDMAAKIKLSPGVLVVEPSEFIVKEKSTRTVTIMLNPSERETGLCHTKSNVVTTIGFFYGDEITRQQYRRTVHKSSTKPMALSENNPLKGVIFDCPYSGEDYVYEAYNLPECSNDVRLFYSCMSRLMLALTGNPPCEKSFYDLEADSTCMSESPGMMPKTEDDTINFDQTINKPGLLPTMHTPPVKGSSNTNGNLRLYQNTQVNGDDNSCTHWEVTPEQILLSTQPDIHQPVNRSRIQLINYTERKLRLVGNEKLCLFSQKLTKMLANNNFGGKLL